MYSKKLLKERIACTMKFKEKIKTCSAIFIISAIILCIIAAGSGNAFIKNTKAAAKTSKTRPVFKNSNLALIDKYIKNGKVIINDDCYYILCNGATKKDMPTGGCAGGIGITIVKDTKEICKKWISSKTITKKQAKLAIGLAIKLKQNNSKDIPSVAYISTHTTDRI